MTSVYEIRQEQVVILSLAMVYFFLMLIKKTNVVAVEELAQRLNSSLSPVHRHLQQFAKLPKLGTSIPYEANCKVRGGIVISLTFRQRNLVKKMNSLQEH